MTGRDAGARRAFGLLAAASAAFTFYGSIVPLDFQPRPFAEAAEDFAHAMAHGLHLAGRADPVVNVLLGVPLGFGLLGAVRAGRNGPTGDFLWGLALLPPCAALAAGVEFAQVYLPERHTSGADVWCQTLGSAAGMVGWVLVGRWAAGPVGRVWARFERGGPAGRLLPGYVLLVATIQALPLDLDPNPREVYRRLQEKARPVPFREFRGADPEAAWRAAGKLVRLAGLFVPAGLLAARLRGRAGADPVWVLAGAAVVAGGTEVVQLGLESRHASVTEALAGVFGVMGGWAVGRLCGRGVGVEGALALGQVWLAVLAVGYWEPWDFRGPSAPFDWVPGVPPEAGHPGHVLEDVLTKLVLFAPLGAAVGAVGARAGGAGRLALAAGVGLAAAAVIEIGHQYLPDRAATMTDVLLGGLGAAAGWWAAARVRGPAGVDPEPTGRA